MNRKRMSVLFVLAMVLGLMNFPHAATVPRLISLEGRLTNPSTGTPYTGPQTIVFSIWDTSSMNHGDLVWQETQTVQLDSNGFFHVTLGSVKPLPPLPDNSWLQLQIGTETLSPRQRITSSAFALRSSTGSTSLGLWNRRIPLLNKITRIDTSPAIIDSAMTIGGDGFPVIAYDAPGGSGYALKVAKCEDATCGEGTIISTVDSTGSVAFPGSIIIASDGLPAISYYDLVNRDLKYVKCGDLSCNPFFDNIIKTIDSTGDVGSYSSMTLSPQNGAPLISYSDRTGGNVKVAACAASTCLSTIAITTLDSSGGFTSISSDGVYPTVAYRDNQGSLKVAKCADAYCRSGITTTLVDSALILYPSMTIGSDGDPVISYYDSGNGDLKVVKCGNTSCSVGNPIIVDSIGDVGQYPSITLGTDGLPIISYYDVTNADLKVAKCLNATCSLASITTVASNGDVGIASSITIGTDGLPIISYYDGTNQVLDVVHCGSDRCIANWISR